MAGRRFNQAMRSGGLLAASMVAMLMVGIAIGLAMGSWVLEEPPPRPESARVYRPPLVTAEPEPYHPPAQPYDAPPPRELAAPPPAAERPERKEAVAPAPPPPDLELPAWQRNAVPVAGVGGRPMIAIVIDDLGMDRARSRAIVALPGPLTAAYLSYAPELQGQTRAARGQGHELLVHMAMEPQSAVVDPGPDVLRVSESAAEIRYRIEDVLSRFEGAVGINNHMGSRFTADERGMRTVMETLKARGLLFLDSVTTDKTLGAELAREYGVPFAERHVFLDNQDDPALVHRQLAKLEEIARSFGYAVGIGHPRDGTITALAEWLPSLRARGFSLVPLSAIVRHRYRLDLASAGR